ncbi:fungal-specific transcription factor domain-containing protein [Mycena alexandri]|uniref:Fungal-specific transcription factor domain-containing protein n=1 Tax=Mycena alexandri TaxID=1745969 RepID=A0AAD6SU16_9AGAR|nr:fungal-specific transcription factor domain-containing protein [Mycena alexandri]
MPVDTTGKTRRAPRRTPTEEEQKEIELKRLRGTACAECRRLKLKCDKNVPCGSCVRRGCESICPLGNLSAGQGTRFILADTGQLHAKIAEMSQRIRQLEEALAILQAVISSERHPLLATDLLSIKFAAEAPARKTPPSGGEQDPPLDALGTLTLSDAGEVRYFGRSAGTETLLVAEDQSDEEDDSLSDGEAPIPLDILELGNIFPQARPNLPKLQRIRTLLPQYEHAIYLCEAYLSHAALFFRPIKRDELLGPFIQAIYMPEDQTEVGNGDVAHALAVLFFVLALGALLDLQLTPYNAEAERYYAAGRAALSLRSVYDSPLFDTVRGVGLMATYHSLAGKKYSRDSAWCLISMAAKLAQSIGLHRDSARWYMDATMVQRRRTLFWEVFVADLSHGLAMGRPPAIHLTYVDCEYPEDEECSLTDDGLIRPGFWRSKYHFARDIWMAMAEATLAAKPPGYATVLELDRRVRELSVPDSYKPYPTRADGEAEYFSSSARLRGAFAGQYRAVTMIYLHRSFFAQAMLDFPANPLRSPFATSFLTAYRSASVIIKGTAYQFDRCADMAMRVWMLLHQTFSAAVIAGTVVTLSPQSNMASSALVDLGLAVDLFERTAKHSHRGKLAFVGVHTVLVKLKERAVRAYTQVVPPSPTAGPPPPQGTAAPPDGAATDELAIFGGQTRLLALKQKPKRGMKSASTSPPLASAAVPGYSSADRGEGAAADEFPWLDDLVAANSDIRMDDAMMGLPPDVYSMLYPQGTEPAAMPQFDVLQAGTGMMPPAEVAAGDGRPTNAMMDLGLTNESGMDAAWLAFIQQCGVTLGESPVQIDDSISLFD